jgi:hypothetical protein
VGLSRDARGVFVLEPRLDIARLVDSVAIGDPRVRDKLPFFRVIVPTLHQAVNH